jgi:hypothetical protein
MRGNRVETQQEAGLIADVLSSIGKITPNEEVLKVPPKATVGVRRRKEARIGKVGGPA